MQSEPLWKLVMSSGLDFGLSARALLKAHAAHAPWTAASGEGLNTTSEVLVHIMQLQSRV